MALFEKVVNADGTETYQEVEMAKLDVREHPEFQKVLKEQIKSRQKASELAKQLQALETPSGEPEAPPEPKADPKPPVVIPTPEEVAALVEKRLAEKATQVQAEKTARETAITNALSKHGLPPSARSLLEESSNPDVTAEKLAKSGLAFADSPAGGNTLTDTEALFARIDKRLKLEK